MAAAKLFKRAYQNSFDQAAAKIDAIRASLDTELEAMAVATFGPIVPADETLFAPPALPVRIHCWHCDTKYLSDKMRLEYRPRMQAAVVDGLGEGLANLQPLWWCKNAECDGAGFGHDLHAISAQPRKRRA